MAADASLLADEDRLWHELHGVADGFTPDQALVPGYFEEGWTAKDAIAHVGTWLAEAGTALERIRGGTYVPLHADEIDALNERFLAAMRDVPLADVRAQATAARARLLFAWTELPEPSDVAAAWIAKAGPDHYREHLPRLREWLDEVRAQSGERSGR